MTILVLWDKQVLKMKFFLDVLLGLSSMWDIFVFIYHHIFCPGVLEVLCLCLSRIMLLNVFRCVFSWFIYLCLALSFKYPIFLLLCCCCCSSYLSVLCGCYFKVNNKPEKQTCLKISPVAYQHWEKNRLIWKLGLLWVIVEIFQIAGLFISLYLFPFTIWSS